MKILVLAIALSLGILWDALTEIEILPPVSSWWWFGYMAFLVAWWAYMLMPFKGRHNVPP